MSRLEAQPAAATPPGGLTGLLRRFYPLHPLRQLRQLRSAPTRTRLGIAVGAAVMLVVLIVACSGVASLALRNAISGLVGSVVTGSSSTSAGAATSAGAVPTPSAAPNGTPSPLVTVTPRPTSQPIPTTAPPEQPLTLAFTCASGSLRGMGQVCVHTQPQAALTISVHYCDGSTAKGLHGSATADDSGNYTWNWPVRTSCAGPAIATVTATWKGQSLSQADTFTITR